MVKPCIFQTGQPQIIGKTDRLPLPHIFNGNPKLKRASHRRICRHSLGDLDSFPHIYHGGRLIKHGIGKNRLSRLPIRYAQFIPLLITIVLHTALPGHIVHWFPFRFFIVHAEIQIFLLIVSLDKRVKSIDHGQLFDRRNIHHDLPSGKIKRQSRFHRDRHIIDRYHVQSAHDARSIEKTVQYPPFIVHIPLFGLKIIHRQKFSIKIFISLKWEIFHIFHWLFSFLYLLPNL